MTLRSDWESAKLRVMASRFRKKFTLHGELCQMLLDTGDAHLEEGNTCGDAFWGAVDGLGQNHLGRIIMEGAR